MDIETMSKIRASALDALAEMGTDMSAESVRRVLVELRLILRLCDDVR